MKLVPKWFCWNLSTVLRRSPDRAVLLDRTVATLDNNRETFGPIECEVGRPTHNTDLMPILVGRDRRARRFGSDRRTTRQTNPTLRNQSCAALIGMVLTIIPALAADETNPLAHGPAIQRLTWHAPQRIRWQLAHTPLWFSVGHINRVLACIPNGIMEVGGQPVLTRDGSGKTYAIDFEVHEVTAFDPTTGVPAATRVLAQQTVRADDPTARNRKHWDFPKEKGSFDWELKLLPEKIHQTLFRIFLQADPQFWQTLMVHTEADLAPLPPTLVAPAGSAQCFKVFLTHILVYELLHDPDLKSTSTYIEPDDPPSTWWIHQQKVKAPWALNRTTLAPAHGSLVVKADGTLQFAVLSAAAREAEKLPFIAEKTKMKMPTAGEDIENTSEAEKQPFSLEKPKAQPAKGGEDAEEAGEAGP